jgi:uncharacterized protein YciI
MFVVLLEFSDNREAAPQHMAGHKAWLDRGFEAGTFLLAGSLRPEAGGGILADNVSRAELEALVAEDPFVAEDVVRPSIHEIAPARADERLAFLAA